MIRYVCVAGWPSTSAGAYVLYCAASSAARSNEASPDDCQTRKSLGRSVGTDRYEHDDRALHPRVDVELRG